MIINQLQDDRIEVQFEATGLLKFIRNIANLNRVVTSIHYLVRTNSNLNDVNPLETDGLPIYFSGEKDSDGVTVEVINGWLFKKALEDFIAGLTLSLIESYILLKLNCHQTNLFDLETFKQEINTITIKAKKLHFPTLVNEIEKITGTPLLLKDEIISINQIRNCLVHKDAIVTELQGITLKYLRMRVMVQKDGEIVELTKELKKQRFQSDEIKIDQVKISRSFAEGDKILLTADSFNDLTYTGIVFMHELIKKLPLPDQIKDQFINPFTLNLVTS